MIVPGVVYWSYGQSPEAIPEIDPRIQLELAREAFFDPEGFAIEMAKAKTAEDFAVEETATLMITHPWDFDRAIEAGKTPEWKEWEAQARYSILHPAEYSAEVERLKSFEQKQKEAEILDAMLNPIRPDSTMAPSPEIPQ